MGKKKLNKNRINLLEVYKALRKVWKINPKSRIKESAKIYNRGKEKIKFIKELNDGQV
jgi:hypothetical protein